MNERDLNGITLAIANMVGTPGISDVVQLDTLLDEVRRMAWISIFAGMPVKYHNSTDPHGNADRIRAMLMGLSLAEINLVIYSTRFRAWGNAFGQEAVSRFGQPFGVLAEHKANPFAPDKMN